MAENNPPVSRAIDHAPRRTTFVGECRNFICGACLFVQQITSYLLDLAIAFSHLACVRAVSDDNYRMVLAGVWICSEHKHMQRSSRQTKMMRSGSFTQHGSLWRLSAMHKVPETDSPTLIYCLLIYNFAKSTELEQVIEKRVGIYNLASPSRKPKRQGRKENKRKIRKKGICVVI